MENNEQNIDPHIDGFENCTEETKRLFAGCRNEEEFLARARELGCMTHEEFWDIVLEHVKEFCRKHGAK